MSNGEVVSAGYFVSRILETPVVLRHGLLPERIMTLSPCLTEFFPGTWAIDWATHSESERIAAAAKLGIRPADVPATVGRLSVAFTASLFGWPDVWFSPDAGREASRDLLPHPEDFALLGLGVPEELVDEFLIATRPAVGESPPGIHAALSRRVPLAPDGDPVGWELLGPDRGTCHSWLCNSVHVAARSKLGVAPGAFGLLESEQCARDIVAMISGDPLIAEPVPWFPGLLVRYAL